MGLSDMITEQSIRAAVTAGSFEVMQWIELRNNHYRAGLALPDAPAYVPQRIVSMKPGKDDSFSSYDAKNPDSAKVRAGAIGSHREILADHPRIAKLFRDLPCDCTYYV